MLTSHLIPSFISGYGIAILQITAYTWRNSVTIFAIPFARNRFETTLLIILEPSAFGVRIMGSVPFSPGSVPEVY